MKCGYSQVCVMKNDDEDALLVQEPTGEPNVGGDGAALFHKTCGFGGYSAAYPEVSPQLLEPAQASCL